MYGGVRMVEMVRLWEWEEERVEMLMVIVLEFPISPTLYLFYRVFAHCPRWLHYRYDLFASCSALYWR